MKCAFCWEDKQEEWQHHAEGEKLYLMALHNSGLSFAAELQLC